MQPTARCSSRTPCMQAATPLPPCRHNSYAARQPELLLSGGDRSTADCQQGQHMTVTVQQLHGAGWQRSSPHSG